jgi:hypothetical protein
LNRLHESLSAVEGVTARCLEQHSPAAGARARQTTRRAAY